jgi:hypothetical protein
MPDAQLHRHSVDLPKALAADLRRCAAKSGVPVSALVYSWISTAAYIAEHIPSLGLPSGDRAPRGSLGATTTVKWSQSDTEYLRCVDAIEALGSTPTAVIREMAKRYVAANGRILDTKIGQSSAWVAA